jgi:hypothetical protein
MSDESELVIEAQSHETGKRYVGPVVTGIMILYLILIALLTMYFIYQAWPAETPATVINLFGYSILMSSEQRLLIIVIMAGSLGSIVAAVRSLYFYVGIRDLQYVWLPMYLLRPVAGATLALVFYLVIRGGFFAPTASVQETSPFGFAALAALVGLFSEQAVLKLKAVAEELFEKPMRAEELASQNN